MDSVSLTILIILIIILILVLICYLIVKHNNKELNDHTSCLWNRYGCCNDKLTPKLDVWGSNCRGF